jgi:lipopolysaccharide transport system permease protein
MLLITNNSARFLYTHRKLLWRVTRNELSARYAGSLLGIGWVVLSPLLVLGIYWVIYVNIFRIRVPGLSPFEYVLYIFSGLVPYLMTAEALSVGVSSVVANKSVLSNTVFPIDLAPAKAVLSSQGTMIVGLMVVVLGTIATQGLSWKIVFLPIVWGLHLMALFGITWILSLLNLVFRDLQNLINAIMMMLLVLSPIAYTPEMVPPILRIILIVNPFAYLVIAYQKTLVLGKLPSATEAVFLVIVSSGLFCFGSWFFFRAKRSLIDYV